MFDIKKFREVNAQYGFSVGDDALRSIARHLSGSVRSVDTVCRYAGDKFALVLPEIDPTRTLTVQKKISDALTTGLDTDRGRVTFDATFAQVHYPTQGASEMELLRKLISVLDAAKDTGASASA